MLQYLESTKYTTLGLIELITSSAEQLSNYETLSVELSAADRLLGDELKTGDSAAEASYFLTRRLDRENLPSELTAAYFKSHRLKFADEASLPSLSGALLQIAHQGIVSSFGEKKSCLAGRKLGGTNLRDVIWEARNQSMHYDEKLSSQTADTFLMLLLTTPFEFECSLGVNLAYEVIRFLGWDTNEKYQTDMLSFIH